jgi:hypothetical protein
MNKIKFQYNNGRIEFFTMFKGTKVIVLTAVLDTGDYEELKRLQACALEVLPEVESALKWAA